MKEATGEASMTGITIAIIAVIAVIAVPIVRGLINSVRDRSCCASLGGTLSGSTCTDANGVAMKSGWQDLCKDTKAES